MLAWQNLEMEKPESTGLKDKLVIIMWLLDKAYKVEIAQLMS
jgi:hypothetical protein